LQSKAPFQYFSRLIHHFRFAFDLSSIFPVTYSIVIWLVSSSTNEFGTARTLGDSLVTSATTSSSSRGFSDPLNTTPTMIEAMCSSVHCDNKYCIIFFTNIICCRMLATHTSLTKSATRQIMRALCEMYQLVILYTNRILKNKI